MTNHSEQERLIQLVNEYADAFAALSPDNLNALSALLDGQVTFQDPFNEKTGRDQFMAIFEHMFNVMEDAHFTILDTASSQNAGYIKWQMGGRLASRPQFDMTLIGMSEVHFNHDGYVIAHIDHWDSASQLLSRIPVAGIIVRSLLKLFRH